MEINKQDIEKEREIIKDLKQQLADKDERIAELEREVKKLQKHIIEFINELAWEDVKYDAMQSTMGEFAGSLSAVPKYAKKYFDLWKEMFGEELRDE